MYFFCVAAGFRCSGFREVSGGPGFTAEEGVLWRRGGRGIGDAFFSSSIRCLLLRFFFNPGE